jgi:ribonuclease Z
MIAVTILGNNSAVPTFERHPTSQVVTLNDQLFLVDCGEGTQIQMIKYKVRRNKISHIFISHLHGDHYFGLIGLINTFGLLGRQQELHVYGPAMLEEIIRLQIKVAETNLPFQLHLHTLTQEGLLVDNDKFSVECFRTTHRIECYGFLFREKKKPRKLEPEKAIAAGIPAVFFERLREGEDYITKEGATIPNDSVTIEATPGKSYAFCADTRYDEHVIGKVKGVDMIYHETTYLDNLRERAEERFHSTSKQAATVAKKAGVGRLLIGHFSSKYEQLDEFEQEAGEIFPHTSIAMEGVSYTI